MTIGFRASKNSGADSSPLNNLGISSEANQWKIHMSDHVRATSTNQIFTIDHGLSYTPAYLVFWRATGFSYYDIMSLGGSNYVSNTKLSIQLNSIGDEATYIIFKDFGA